MSQHDRYLEVEAKLWVPDLDAVSAQLAVTGGVLRRERTFERNVRYDDAQGSLTPRGIVLRLRQDDRARLTYKDQTGRAFEGLQARFEAEVTFAALSDFETMDVILGRLGFRPAMIYEKYRAVYTLGGAEVVLDEMPFGHFVEIEGEPAAIESCIEGLGLAAHTRFRESYAQLFDHVRANMGLAFTDLTFENFAGIIVPLEAFRSPEE